VIPGRNRWIKPAILTSINSVKNNLIITRTVCLADILRDIVAIHTETASVLQELAKQKVTDSAAQLFVDHTYIDKDTGEIIDTIIIL